MRNGHRWIPTGMAAAILVTASCALAQDWPQWRGPDRDGKVAGFKAPDSWPTSLARKWEVKVGSGDATPALVGDALYVFVRQGDAEVLLCLDAATGKQRWTQGHEARAVTGAASRHPGPRSSPAVADGKVVTLGVAGDLTCFNASDGKVVWRKNPFPDDLPQFFTAMSPLVVDGKAVAHLGGKDKGAVIAYDLATGEEAWRWDAEGPDYASPVVMTVGGTKQIVTLTVKSLVGLAAADGKLLWKLAFPTERRAYNAATPIVDGATVIYTGAKRGTHAVRIEKEGDGFAAKKLWSNADVDVQFNTPVLKDGLLFGLTADGRLFCLDAKTGKTAWTGEDRHGRGFAAMLDAGSCLLALPSTSELIAFKPDAGQYGELARIKVAETATYAHPVVAGNRIYVKAQETLTLYTME